MEPRVNMACVAHALPVRPVCAKSHPFLTAGVASC